MGNRNPETPGRRGGALSVDSGGAVLGPTSYSGRIAYSPSFRVLETPNGRAESMHRGAPIPCRSAPAAAACPPAGFLPKIAARCLADFQVRGKSKPFPGSSNDVSKRLFEVGCRALWGIRRCRFAGRGEQATFNCLQIRAKHELGVYLTVRYS